MNSMPMYPTMMYNQQGMLMPVMSLVPPSAPAPAPLVAEGSDSRTIRDDGGPSSQNNTGSNKDDRSHLGSQSHQQPNNGRARQQAAQQLAQTHQVAQLGQQHFRRNSGQFDNRLDGIAPPPDGGLEIAGLSFGSVGSVNMLTEDDLKRLDFASNSTLGSSSNNSNGILLQHHQEQQSQQHQFLQQQQQLFDQYQVQQQQHQNSQQRQGNEDLAKAAPPPEGGLEPQGFSFGSVSIMSISDAKLEPTGVSFGSAMSFKTTPEMVDGGLDGIGTSFGSMTLATNAEEPYDVQHNQHNIMPPLPPPPPTGPRTTTSGESVPTLFRQNRSGGNLLECSDTDSDDEEQSAQKSQQKNLEWEKMKALVDKGGEDGIPQPMPTSFPSSFAMPGTTTFARDLSQMSALSAGDAQDPQEQNIQQMMMAVAAMPPPTTKKQDEETEWEKAQLLMLKNQQSQQSRSSNNFGN